MLLIRRKVAPASVNELRLTPYHRYAVELKLVGPLRHERVVEGMSSLAEPLLNPMVIRLDAADQASFGLLVDVPEPSV